MFEKEAEEYYEDVTVGTFQEGTENFADAVLTAYKDGAEFGYNKANEELEEKIEVKKLEMLELKEQIEKMKCCENCRYYSRTYEHCYSYDAYQNCKSLSNWRLAEC